MASINDLNDFFNKEEDKNNIFIFTHASRIKCIMNELFGYSFKKENNLKNLDIISITKKEENISIYRTNFSDISNLDIKNIDTQSNSFSKSQNVDFNKLINDYNIFIIRHGFAYHNKLKDKYKNNKIKAIRIKLIEMKENTELVDHGITESNKSGKNFQKFYDLKKQKNYIFISDLKRTFQTFEYFFYGTYLQDKTKTETETETETEIENTTFKYLNNCKNIESIHILPCSHELTFNS